MNRYQLLKMACFSLFLLGYFATVSVSADTEQLSGEQISPSGATGYQTAAGTAADEELRQEQTGVEQSQSELFRSGQRPESPASESGYILRVLGGLFGIIGLILVLAWLTRRLGSGAFLPSREMKVIFSMAVGQRERVVLIEVGQKQLLLGVTTQNINTLHSFDEPVVEQDNSENVLDFKSRFQEYIKR